MNKRMMDKMMQNREPFTHLSYSAFFRDDNYVLKHWDTEIAWVGPSGDLVMFDTGYYSNTTSGFQGKIIRHALSGIGRAQLRELLGSNKLRGIMIESGSF